MKALLMGFLLSIVLFATPAFSADYYGQEAWTVPMGLSVGLSGNYGGCTGDCGEAIKPGGGIGLNIAYRPSMSFGVYLEVLDNFVHPENEEADVDYTFIQGNIGLNFYLFPDSKFQPLITGGLGNFHMRAEDSHGNEYESEEQQTIFLGFGGEYILNDHMTVPFKLQYSKIVYNDNSKSKDSLWNVVVGFNYYF